MKIFKIKANLLFILLTASMVYTQFKEVNVIIDTRQIRENEKFIFESLANDVSEYYENNQFIDNSFDLELYLDIHFIIESYSMSGNSKVVNAQIFLTNQADQHYYAKGVDFPYSKGQSLQFSTIFSPLTSILNYYANLFIGSELDTYEYLGGDIYFTKSDEITNDGRNSNFPRNWEKRKKKIKKIKENRYLRSIRFHYFAIQDIIDSKEIDKKKILFHLEESLHELSLISEIYGHDRNTSLFLKVYGENLAKLFKKYKLSDGIILLNKIDPDNNTTYSKLIDR